MSELSDQLKAVLALEPDAQAMDFEEHWQTWGDLSAMVRELRQLLAPFGSPEGLRVGLIMANRPFTAGAVLNSILDNRCLVTLNSFYPDERIAEDMEDCRAPVVIISERDLKRDALRETAVRRGIRIIAVAEGEGGRVSFSVAHEGDPSASHHVTNNPGIAVEMMTSGTTGRPKRIPIPATNISRSVMGQTLYESGPPGPRLRSGVSVLTTSFAHIGGLSAMLYALASGRRSCVVERTRVESVLAALRRHRPRVLRIPPAIVRGLLDAGVTKDDLSSLSAIRSGTAPLDPALVDIYLEKFGIPILQNYGATEFGGAAGWSIQDFREYWSTKRGSVGRLSKGIEGRIVDPESGEELPAGSPGALAVRAPHIGDGSWVQTTDLAILDEDGFLFLKGRLDNIINRGGFKIVPDDVQRVLETHPDIAEATVIGLPDPRLGHVPAALVVLRDGAPEPSADELGNLVKASLAPYNAPVRYRFVETLPRTPSMKVDGAAARAMLTEASEADA